MKARLIVKEDCSLCDAAHAILQRIAHDVPLQIEVLRLEEHPEFGPLQDLPHVWLGDACVARMKVSEYRLRKYLREREGDEEYAAQPQGPGAATIADDGA